MRKAGQMTIGKTHLGLKRGITVTEFKIIWSLSITYIKIIDNFYSKLWFFRMGIDVAEIVGPILAHFNAKFDTLQKNIDSRFDQLDMR